MKEILNKEELLKCDLNEKVIYNNEVYHIEEIHQSSIRKYVILEHIKKHEYKEIDIE